MMLPAILLLPGAPDPLELRAYDAADATVEVRYRTHLGAGALA